LGNRPAFFWKKPEYLKKTQLFYYIYCVPAESQTKTLLMEKQLTRQGLNSIRNIFKVIKRNSCPYLLPSGKTGRNQPVLLGALYISISFS
jgi:hypothetical protein